MTNRNNLNLFAAVYEALKSRNLVGVSASVDSDADLVYEASMVVWDCYCSIAADEDSRSPALVRIQADCHPRTRAIDPYIMYVFEGDVYIKVVSHGGRIHLDTSGPVFP